MKTILILFLFALTLQTSHAQTLGFKVSAIVSNTFDSESSDFSDNAKVGYGAGLFARYPITSILGIQPEVLFAQRGFIGNGNFLGADYRLDRTLNYVDVPVMVALMLTPNITVVAGPQYSYLFKQSDKYTSGNTAFTRDTNFEDHKLDSSNISLTGGIDVDMDPLVIGLRTGWDTKSWFSLSVGFRL